MKKDSGITLVALVITIIILILLTVVSIKIAIDSNLISITVGGTENYNKEQTKEAEELTKIEDLLKSIKKGEGGSSSGDLVFSSKVIELMAKTGYELTIKDLFEIETAREKILRNEQNVDYIFANKDKYLDDILDCANARREFFSNEGIIDKILSDIELVEKILNSENGIKALDESNPITVPKAKDYQSGKIFESGHFSGYYGWNIFDKNINTYWAPTGKKSYKDEYVAYSFDKPVWLYKTVAAVSEGKQNAYYVIEGSNDKVSWVALSDNIYQGDTKTIIANRNVTKYQHYRLRFTNDTVSVSGTDNTVVCELEFYCK